MQSAADQAATLDGILRLGMAALNQGRFAEAERLARNALDRQPQHAEAIHLLGVSLLAQQRAKEAVAALERVAPISSNAAVETHYALALLAVGRRTEALDWLDRATSRQPPFPRAFRELGIVLCSVRRYGEAEGVLKRGLALAPHGPELWVELGGVYICRADPVNAKTSFARALTYAPNHVRALHGFGTALLFEGEFDRAAEQFRRALVGAPNHIRARLDLAHCMLELERDDEALDVLRFLVSMDPKLRGKALKVLVSASRGRFWLQPSVAASVLLAPNSLAARSS
jgi:Flp pilus assembly protein TadD